MNLSVLIIDDEPEHTVQLMNYLKRLPYLVTIKAVNNAEAALEDIIQQNYDLLFLDLEMPGINGIELLQTMPLPPTIVVSAYPAYSINCYDHDSVVDFIEKPLTFARLLRALQRVNKKIELNENKHLFLKVGRKVQHFQIDTIRYIEADGIYSKVWVKDGTFTLVNSNISETEKLLLHTRIVRLHKSYIFNLDYITTFDSRNLWLGELKFQLGVNYRGKLEKLLNLVEIPE